MHGLKKVSHLNLVPRALLPHLEAPRQVSQESHTGTRGSRVVTWLNLFEATLLEILAVLSRLKMNFTIYTDPSPSPVCLKVPENSEVLKLFMNLFVR